MRPPRWKRASSGNRACEFDSRRLRHALLAQRSEQVPLKDKVQGSNPWGGTLADIAQLVERVVANDEATGSSPVVRSNSPVTDCTSDPPKVGSHVRLAAGRRDPAGTGSGTAVPHSPGVRFRASLSGAGRIAQARVAQLVERRPRKT